MKSIKYIKNNSLLFFMMSIYFLIGIITIYTFRGKLISGHDDLIYINSAKNLLNMHMLTCYDKAHPTVYIMPGLPIILSWFISLFKHNALGIFRLFQIILNTACLYLIYIIGKKIFNEKIALICVFLNIIYIPHYSVEGFILTEILFKFLFLILVYISMLAIDSKQYKYYILGGILLGLCCLIRPNVAVFPIIIFLIWIIKKYSLLDMIKFGTVTVITLAIIMSPWWIRNYKIFSKFIPLTESSGNPFYAGTFINFEKPDFYVPEKMNYKIDEKLKDFSEINYDMNSKKQGQYIIEKGFSTEPLKYSYWYTVGKVIYTWKNPHLGCNMFYIYKYGKIYHRFFILLSFLGILCIFKKDRDYKKIYIALIPIIFTIFNLPFIPDGRYVYPFIELCFLCSSYFIYTLKFHSLKNIENNAVQGK